MGDAEATDLPIVFRTNKKRKAFRQRPHDEQEDIAGTPTLLPPEGLPPPPMDTTQREDSDADDGGLSVAEALRQRNARKARLRGVGFSARPTAPANGNEEAENRETSLVVRQDEAAPTIAAPIGGITTRFAPQTGRIGELVNKHMEEYVESKLAKRHSAAQASANQEQNQEERAANGTRGGGGGSLDFIPAPPVPAGPKQKPDDRTVMHGKLMEIDLGEEARSRNVALTERAQRRLRGELNDDDNDDDNAAENAHSGNKGPPRKVRIGRDGKPWRPRRNRRGSDDVKRDLLVEAVMHENRLDVYDTAGPSVTATAAAAMDGRGASGAAAEGEIPDGAADERIAEEFRREFMDAMGQRRQRKKAAAPSASSGPGAGSGPAGRGKDSSDVLRGPKLGGSRNQRAAVRDLLLQKEREKNKLGKR